MNNSHNGLIGIVTGLLLVCISAQANSLTIVTDGDAFGHIVVSTQDSATVIEAVDELRQHLRKSTGALFRPWMATGKDFEEDCAEIVVGAKAAKDRCGIDISKENLGDQGYIIRTVGNRLIIAGQTDIGTLYGVYGFLEDYVGVRWFTPEVTKIPRHSDLDIGDINDRFVPVFDARLVGWANHRVDIGWSARLRTNYWTHTTHSLDKKHLLSPHYKDAYHYVSGRQAHTMELLLPSGKYYAKHPEYFAEIGGKRSNSRHAEPCLTNPEVAEIMAKKAMAWAASAKQANAIVEISQNDYGMTCQCAKCRAAQKEKGTARVYLEFVNEIAKQIQQQYPDVLVGTLAYKSTRQPTKSLKLSPNMVVRYAHIGHCRRHGFHCQDDEARDGKKWLEEWLSVSPRVWVWYYSGGPSLAPWVNIHAYQADFRYFAKIGVKGLFLEGSAAHPALNMGDLKAYVLAKLAWNPQLRTDELAREFVDYVYGPAAPQVQKFVDMVYDDASYLYPQKFYRYGQGIQHYAGLLKPEAVSQMFDLFKQAEERVSGNEELTWRLNKMRLYCDYFGMLYLADDDPRRCPAAERFFGTAKNIGLGLWMTSWDLDGSAWKKKFYCTVDDFHKAYESGAVVEHIKKQMAARTAPFYGGKLIGTVDMDTFYSRRRGWLKHQLLQGKVTATAEGLLIGKDSYIAYPGAGAPLHPMRYTPFTIELDMKLTGPAPDQTIMLLGGKADEHAPSGQMLRISTEGQRIRITIRSRATAVPGKSPEKVMITKPIPDLFNRWHHLSVAHENDVSSPSRTVVSLDGQPVNAVVAKPGHGCITDNLVTWKLGPSPVSAMYRNVEFYCYVKK